MADKHVIFEEFTFLLQMSNSQEYKHLDKEFSNLYKNFFEKLEPASMLRRTTHHAVEYVNDVYVTWNYMCYTHPSTSL